MHCFFDNLCNVLFLIFYYCIYESLVCIFKHWNLLPDLSWLLTCITLHEKCFPTGRRGEGEGRCYFVASKIHIFCERKTVPRCEYLCHTEVTLWYRIYNIFPVFWPDVKLFMQKQKNIPTQYNSHMMSPPPQAVAHLWRLTGSHTPPTCASPQYLLISFLRVLFVSSTLFCSGDVPHTVTYWGISVYDA